MPSSTVNICVLALVLLSLEQICHCRPHRSKRGLVKDYFVPDTLVFSSDKFEKGEDGKYYLKKSAHMQDSEVNYISAENDEMKNGVVPDVSKIEATKDESKSAEFVNTKTDPNKKELSEKEVELFPSSAAIQEAKEPEPEKIATKDEKVSFMPVDTEFTVPPKPDAKDEVGLKTDLPLIESGEEGKEKVSIGQVPELSSRLVPEPENGRMPILIPIRHISYRTMKIIPIPPADISDRLPVPYEDDIVGEGAHESESEEVSQPLAEKESGYPIVNPLTSLLSFHDVLKGLKEASKGDVENESKVMDVLGKKFLMQSNVMKYPSSRNSHTFIRFLSMKPLDEVKPAEPKEVTAEETPKKELDIEERKSIEIEKEESTTKEKEESTTKEKGESATKEKEEIRKDELAGASEIKKEAEEKVEKETDILKAEETELKLKIDRNVPKDVMLKNVGAEEAGGKMVNTEKEVKSVEEFLKETSEHKLPQTEFKEADLKLIMEVNKDMDIREKAESQVEVKKNKDYEMKKGQSEKKEINKKINDESKRDGDSILKTMKGKKEMDEKMESDMKKYEEKKMDIDSKKDLFLLEKKKKEKSVEEMDEAKHKNKNEKKKKKCKCEEKDSDSEDDADE